VLADGRTNRRELSDHEKVLRAKFPDDGRKVRGWLRRPGSAMNALGFLPSIHDVKLGRDLRPVRRVTRPPSAPSMSVALEGADPQGAPRRLPEGAM